MIKLYLRYPAISLMVVLISFSTCMGQIKSNHPLDSVSALKINSDLKELVNAGIDPYFVESTDTISKYGPRCIVRDLLQDIHGNYWLATWQGIIKYDGKVFTNYTLKEGLIRFHVSCCYEDKKGYLWFGTARGGVYRYDPSATLRTDGKVFKLFTTKDGLVDNNVSCVMEDKAGNMWFGTENGVSRYNGKTFFNFKNQGGPDGKYVNSIIEDKTGKIWIGTIQGLFIFNGNTSSSEQQVFTEFKNKEGLSIKVWSLLEDKKGKIWIGRTDGLTHFDGASQKDFLSNYLSYYIIEDKVGNVWLSHSEPNTQYTNLPQQILYKFDGKSFVKAIEKYEPEDFQIFGKIEDSSGNIIFGTMQGVRRYDGKILTNFPE